MTDIKDWDDEVDENYIDVMVAANLRDALAIKINYPQYFHFIVVTPKIAERAIQDNSVIMDYVWTPMAKKLRASVRMKIRGTLSRHVNEKSQEWDFPG